MNLEAFCYLGLLRFAEQLELSLALLPNGEREEAAKLLASMQGLSHPELARRWSKLRRDEYSAIRTKAREQTGLRLDDLPPSLREQWIAWIENQNG